MKLFKINSTMHSVEEDHMTTQSDLWEHYCAVDSTSWSVAKDSACNWCGLTESQALFEEQEKKGSIWN